MLNLWRLHTWRNMIIPPMTSSSSLCRSFDQEFPLPKVKTKQNHEQSNKRNYFLLQRMVASKPLPSGLPDGLQMTEFLLRTGRNVKGFIYRRKPSVRVLFWRNKCNDVGLGYGSFRGKPPAFIPVLFQSSTRLKLFCRCTDKRIFDTGYILVDSHIVEL